MSADARCRAMQHLLVQGFTLYTFQAAVCTRLGAQPILDSHPWAVCLDSSSLPWVEQLSEADPLRPRLVQAASASLQGERVLCHWEGVYLELSLTVDEVRHARARLEIAKNLGVEPTSLEGMTAIPDEVLELELKRRRRTTAVGNNAKTPES